MANLKVEIDQVVNNITIDEENVVVEVGTSGPQGPRGSGVLNGSGEPSPSFGIVGDFYINTDNFNLYGPKTNSGWGTPIDLVGSNELGYVYTQSVPASTWNITHGLGFVPNITVVDSGGTVVEGSYNYPNNNSVVLTFTGSFTGKAYLS
jgi:hypothetical protein